jgi:hypothetical protein
MRQNGAKQQEKENTKNPSIFAAFHFKTDIVLD